MIDRIIIYIKDIELDDVKERLVLFLIVEAKDGSSIYSTQLRNLNVTYKVRSMWIAGSLHKYAKGNNYSLFTYEEAKNVLLELSAYIGISLEYFVSSIELTVNIQMEKNTEKYLAILHS